MFKNKQSRRRHSRWTLPKLRRIHSRSHWIHREQMSLKEGMREETRTIIRKHDPPLYQIHLRRMGETISILTKDYNEQPNQCKEWQDRKLHLLHGLASSGLQKDEKSAKKQGHNANSQSVKVSPVVVRSKEDGNDQHGRCNHEITERRGTLDFVSDSLIVELGCNNGGNKHCPNRKVLCRKKRKRMGLDRLASGERVLTRYTLVTELVHRIL